MSKPTLVIKAKIESIPTSTLASFAKQLPDSTRKLSAMPSRLADVGCLTITVRKMVFVILNEGSASPCFGMKELVFPWRRIQDVSLRKAEAQHDITLFISLPTSYGQLPTSAENLQSPLCIFLSRNSKHFMSGRVK